MAGRPSGSNSVRKKGSNAAKAIINGVIRQGGRMLAIPGSAWDRAQKRVRTGGRGGSSEETARENVRDGRLEEDRNDGQAEEEPSTSARAGNKSGNEVTMAGPDPTPEASEQSAVENKANKDRPSVKMHTFKEKWSRRVWEGMFTRDGPPKNIPRNGPPKKDDTSEGRPNKCEPRKATACTGCGETPLDGIFYRCTQCLHGLHLCKQCCVKGHALNPLHVIEEWEDRRGFWLKIPLIDLGMVINLGHGGPKCYLSSMDPRKVVMIHEHGIQHVNIRFCKCGNVSDGVQLIEAGFWPGTWERPGTVMTLQLMRQFQLQSAQSQVNARDFYDYLRRLTNNTCAEEVPDRYRQFLTSCREYMYIKLCKYAGVKPEAALDAGSLAVLCPACPQPGINMDLKNAQDRPEKLKFLDALYHAVDGNFSQNMKDKNSDMDDIPLTTGGSAYYAFEKDVETYLRNVPKGPREPSTCHKFGALGYYGHWGSVSGTIGVSCARHMFMLPGGCVDLQKGERFANVDIALLCALQRWMELPLWIRGYDIHCQYMINLAKRMEEFRKMPQTFQTVLLKHFPRTIAGIGKFHAPAHTLHCRFKFSFNYLPGVGMTDGESPERIWAAYNAIAMRAREMSPGHRHDMLCYYLSDLNVRRVHKLAGVLQGRWVRAVEYAEKTAEYVEQLEEEIKASDVMGEEMLNEWKAREEEWKLKVVDLQEHEELENPYEIKEEDRLSRQETMAILSQQAKESGYLEGVVGTIEEGIELQEIKAVLLQELSEENIGQSLPTALQEDYTKFGERVEAWREKAVMFLAPMVDEAASALSDEERAVAAAALETEVALAEMDEEVAEWMPIEENEERSGKRQRGEDGEGVQVDDKGKTVAKTTARRPTARQGRRKMAPTLAEGTSTSTPTLLSQYSVKRKREGADGEGGVGKGKKRYSEQWHAINDIKIELPSSYHSLIREHKAVEGAVKIETSMRRLQAADALDGLRMLLITSYGLNADRRKLAGQKQMTRALNALKRAWMQIRVKAGQYRRVRQILVKLGMAEDDQMLRPLRREDVKAFIVIGGEEQLGDSKKMPSWIWENISFLKKGGEGKVREYCIEAYRVHWFRMHALGTRWWEEKMLVPVEMWRTVEFFRYFEELWKTRAKTLTEEESMDQAAYARKQSYRYTTLLHGCHIAFKNGPALAVDAIEAWYGGYSAGMSH